MTVPQRDESDAQGRIASKASSIRAEARKLKSDAAAAIGAVKSNV